METVNLKKSIARSKYLMKYDSPLIFREYSKAYFSTTEFISSYLDKEEYNKDRALTVLSSGDHVFNLASKGIKEIDAFDINRLQYLKLAMLRKLSYQEFIKICKIFNYSFFRDDIIEMINSLKKEMPEDVYEYFRKILELAEKEEGSIWNLFYNVYHSQLEIANSYLACENNYLETRKKITDTKVNLYFEDVRKIPELVDTSYDIILLSNISDYLGKANILLTVEDFKAYIASFYDLLNKEGLLIDYLYRINCKYIISNSLVTVDNLDKGNVVACTRNLGYYRVRK